MTQNKRLARKLFLLLGLLAAGLTALATVPVKNAEALICCSACDWENPSAPCRWGCNIYC